MSLSTPGGLPELYVRVKGEGEGLWDLRMSECIQIYLGMHAYVCECVYVCGYIVCM